MLQFTLEKHIAAPPARVFAAASDFQNAPQRIRGIERVEMLTSGPVGVGTRFKETRVMFKKEATEEMEVTAFDPPRSYTLGCESCGCRYSTVLRFTPKDAGTDVSFTFEAVPLTSIAKVMSFLMKPMIKSSLKMIARDLDDLKASLEGPAASGAAAATPA
jgi:carbon monoxide dehydrogenase subunit G